MLRHEMAYNEATRDPIFLFQVARYIFLHDRFEDRGVCYDPDAEGIVKIDGGDHVSNKELVELECAKKYWETDSVWYSREEREGYAKRRHYHFGRLDEDCRVYCVCAEGTLAEVLNAHDSCQPPKPAQQ